MKTIQQISSYLDVDVSLKPHEFFQEGRRTFQKKEDFLINRDEIEEEEECVFYSSRVSSVYRHLKLLPSFAPRCLRREFGARKERKRERGKRESKEEKEEKKKGIRKRSSQRDRV